MGVNVYPQPSSAGKPNGAKELIFGGNSSVGTYTYTGSLPAGNYVAEIRYTTSALVYTSSGIQSRYWEATSPFQPFSITGGLGTTYTSGLYGQGQIPIFSTTNSFIYTRQSDGLHYFNIPSTDTGITITAGYTQKTGTTVSTWTQASTSPFTVMDITSLDNTGDTITIGTGPADGFNYRYFNPEILESYDNGNTWTRMYGMGDFVSSSYPLSNFLSNTPEPDIFTTHGTTNLWIRYVGDKYYIMSSPVTVQRLSYSEDLNAWSPVPQNLFGDQTNDYFFDLAYNTATGAYAAVGRNAAGQGLFGISVDGYIMNSAVSITDQPRGIAYGNGVFVAPTSSTYAMRSTDGVTWSTVASITTGLSRGVYGTRFVFHANPGSGNYFAHSTDGVTWASVASGLSQTGTKQVQAIAYGNSVYVAGDGNGGITRSTDGITWSSTGITPNFGTTAIRAIAYGAGLFVAVAESGQIRTSTDGILWATRTSNVTGNILALDYGSKGFFGLTSNSFSLTSTDGITWTAVPHGTSGPFPVWSTICGIPKKQHSIIARNIVYTTTGTITSIFHGSSYAGYSGIGTYGLSISSTSNTFYRQSAQNYGDMRAYISYPGNNTSALMVFGTLYSNYNRAYFNINSNTWSDLGGGAPLRGTSPYAAYGARVNAAIYAVQKGLYVIAGEKGALSTATSTESTWTTRSSTFGITRINALTFGGVYVAGGDSGQIRTSTDAITWTTRTSGFGSNAIRALSWNGSVYIAAGQNGTLTTSTDAVTWTVRTSGFGTNDILCITPSILTKYPEGNLSTVTAIGGKNGSFATSTDGITWTTKSVPYYSLSVQNINYNGSEYYAVGGSAPFRTGLYYTTPRNAYPYWSFATYYSRGPALLAASTDGVTWTRREFYSSSNNVINQGYHSPSIAHKTGAGYVLTYYNGAVWSTSTTVSTGNLVRSTDGVTWTTATTTILSNVPKRVAVANNIFFAWDIPGISNNASNIMSQSTDSITWTTVTLPTIFTVRDISYLNGNYFVTRNSGSSFYTSTDLSFWVPRLVSNAHVATYDSSTSSYIVFTQTGRTYTSTNLVTWTERVSLGYSNPYKVVSAGTGKFIVSTSIYGQDITYGSESYAYNINEVALYGDPINGWTPIVPSSSSSINSISDGGFAYNSTNQRVVSSFGTLSLQYGTLSSGTVSFGTSVPSYIALYSTDQGALN